LGFWAFVNQLEADQDHLLNETDAGSAAQPASPCPDSHNSIAAHKRSTFTPFGASSAAPSSSLTRPRFVAHPKFYGKFKPSKYFTYPTKNSSGELDDAAATDSQC